MSVKGRCTVQLLRVFWVAITLWCEALVFYFNVGRCQWPDSGFSSPAHILLVADPQILDHRSYPDRPHILTYLTRLIVDLNIRKSWRAALSTRPDVVIFLGDMMDGGRSTITDTEYERYYLRFQNIFSTPPQLPVYFIPGNHDIGLRLPSSISVPARNRYKSHFGDLNSRLSIANHTLVLLDAPSLVEEDYKRADSGQSYNEWHALPEGSVEFINVIAKDRSQDPVVLFSHIPLYRNTSHCGPLREKGGIHPGGGFGYQNTVGEDATTFLLQTLRPSSAFSGDDHDYCVHYHPASTQGDTNPIREVSVKSISMSMGIRYPGFQLLSLDPWDGQSNRPQITQANAPCFLPDQLGIYLSVYIPLLLVSILIVFVINTRRVGLSIRQPTRRTSSPPGLAKPPILGSHHQVEGSYPGPTEDRPDATPLVLPYPVLAPSDGHRYCDLFCQFGERVYKLFPGISSQPKSRRRGRTSVLGSSFIDMWDIAIYPLGIFMMISFYTMFT